MFVGRSAELAVLRAQFQEVRSGQPRVVLVEGDAGVGKSTLVERYIGEITGSDDVRVLRASGDEDEREIPGALLDQLLRAAGARSSTDGAGLVAEPVGAGSALLDAIGAQGDAVVVLVCEDAHWADVPSLRVLAFALRRFVAERVLTIVTFRPEGGVRLPEGIVRLADGATGARVGLHGLDIADVRALALALGGGELSPRQAERLREHTGGNPLHITTLVHELGPDGLRVPADTPLPAPRSLSPLVLAQLHRLAEPARDVVIAAAVLGLRSSVADVALVADTDDVLGALEQIATLGFVVVEGFGPDQHVRFSHPLVRAAIYHDLGPAVRAELHGRAATASSDVHTRLRHREAAATGPDGELSQAFADLAQRHVANGNLSQAARCWASAGRLQPDRRRRERLLGEAAACHVSAGEIAEALAFSEDAKAFAPGPVRDYLLAYPPALQARPDECLELLRRAWDEVDKVADPRLASYIAIRASTNASMHSPLDDLETWARRALELDPTGDMTGNAMFSLAVGLGNAGRYRDGLDLIDRLRERRETSPIARGRWLLPSGLLRFWSDDVTAAHADLVAAVETLRHSGPTLSWLVAINPLIDVEYRLGRWDDAVAHAQLGVSAIADLDFNVLSPYMSAIAAFPSASRGDWVEAERHLATAKRALEDAGGALNVTFTGLAEARLATARGDHEGVVAAFVPIVALGDDSAWADPAVLASRDVHAEALVALRRWDDAREIVDRLHDVAGSRGVPSMIAAAARVRGALEAALGNDAAAQTAFSSALDASPDDQPFRKALVELAYGSFLRRGGRRREAQTHLSASRDVFDALRALPYVERVDRELAATGLAPQRRRTREPTRLTPQENAVVHLARTGYTNKEIGSELVISVRTVEYHLKNAYLKLGVSSRRELIRAGAESN